MPDKEKPHKARKQYRRPLPPLDYLLAFEATADCGSFAAASKAMNISETAISRKVRLLEEHFGVTFFDRRHRSIELTTHGRIFLNHIQPALDMLRAAAGDLHNQNINRPVVLAATNSVASLWLGSRLNMIRQTNKHLKIMLVSSDNDQECMADTVDLAILRGDGDWPGYASTQLFGETVFPVCSPEFLKANPKAADIAALADLPLIEVASIHTEWMDWRTWLFENGHEYTAFEQSFLFNTYPLSIQAAVDGVGVALGWAHLVDHLIAAGKLVRPLGLAEVQTTHGYYLLIPQNKPRSPGSRATEAWLRDISASRNHHDTFTAP